MKISKKDLNLCIILLGLIVILCSYFFGVKKLEEKTAEVENENSALRAEVQTLEPLVLKQKEYAKDTQEMIAVGKALQEYFPVEVRVEDQIMYADELENVIGCYVSYVETPPTTYLDIPMNARENVLSSLADITGAIAAHSATNPKNILDASGLLMGASASVNTFTCTYDQFKELVTYITEDRDVKSIDNITLSYDSTTGNLSGNMMINYYSMRGTGKTYTPPTTSVAGRGVDCIFGSLAEEPEVTGME